jgi:hypothetical protein
MSESLVSEAVVKHTHTSDSSAIAGGEREKKKWSAQVWSGWYLNGYGSASIRTDGWSYPITEE